MPKIPTGFDILLNSMGANEQSKWLRELASMAFDSTSGALNDSWGEDHKYLRDYLNYVYGACYDSNLILTLDSNDHVLGGNGTALQRGDEEKINFLVFNTGLTVPNINNIDNCIRACFWYSPQEERWRSAGCHRIGDEKEAWTRRISFDKSTKQAVFAKNGGAELIYMGKATTLHTNHIVEQRLYRFPSEWVFALAEDCCVDGAQLKAFLEKLEQTGKMHGLVRFDPKKEAAKLGEGYEVLLERVRRKFRDALTRACNEAKKDLRVAEQGYYHDKKREGWGPSLLLPLVISDEDLSYEAKNFNLVATLSRTDEGYAVRTVLTPEMAYRDARVVRMPSSGWLYDYGIATGRLVRNHGNNETIEVGPLALECGAQTLPIFHRQDLGRESFEGMPQTVSRGQGVIDCDANGSWWYEPSLEAKNGSLLRHAGESASRELSAGGRYELKDGDVLFLAVGAPAIVVHLRGLEGRAVMPEWTSSTEPGGSEAVALISPQALEPVSEPELVADENPTPLSDAESFAKYEASAEAGDPDAMYELAVCYESGKGCERDMELSKEWYLRAAESGHELAKYVIEVLWKYHS